MALDLLLKGFNLGLNQLGDLVELEDKETDMLTG
jgi:hypothetical protein